MHFCLGTLRVKSFGNLFQMFSGFHQEETICSLIWLRSEALPGGTCSLVPLKYIGLFPCSPKIEKKILTFPVPQYCLCSPVLLKIWPLFPCSPEINALFSRFPQTPGRASVLAVECVALLLCFTNNRVKGEYLTGRNIF